MNKYRYSFPTLYKTYFLISFFLLFTGITFAQNQKEQACKYLNERGEVYFRFKEADISKIQTLSKIISIDKRQGALWNAYANNTEFEQFLKFNYDYEVLLPPSLSVTKATITMATDTAAMKNWDCYPTYPVYLQLMQGFAQNYPDLCKIDTIGYSVKGRLILATKISKNVNAPNTKPEFFYSSSMHGDELTGYVLMLRLIDYLLKENSSNPLVDSILQNINIYINPLANPDGAYYTSNNTVSGAIRYNANQIDLNRNFPKIFSSSQTTNIQVENQSMMNYFSSHKFVFSANLHGGAEVINYPWDTYTSAQKNSADVNWWKFVSKSFVDTCRKISTSCFSDVDPSGITDGGDWYTVSNGRQDYVNAYHHCREATMEISTEKLLSSNQLNTYWNFLYKSFLYYLSQTQYGLKGIVTDSITNEPLRAKIWINGYDKDSSQVYSFLPYGNYNRLLKAGTYSVTFSAPGYLSKTFGNISIADFSALELNVLLNKGQDTIGISKIEAVEKKCLVYPNPVIDEVTIISSIYPISSLKVFDMKSKMVLNQKIETPVFSLQLNLKEHTLIPGIYIVQIIFSDNTSYRKKIIVE